MKVSFKQSEYSVRESDGRVAITIQAARRYYYSSFYVKIRARVNTNLRPYGMWLFVATYGIRTCNLHTYIYIRMYVHKIMQNVAFSYVRITYIFLFTYVSMLLLVKEIHS